MISGTCKLAYFYLGRPQEIDEAARRRFVKRLYIPLPEGVARRQIVTNLMSQQKHRLTEADLEAIVEKSQGTSMQSNEYLFKLSDPNLCD